MSAAQFENKVWESLCNFVVPYWLVAVWLCTCIATEALAATSAQKPNIVIILADDLGYGDLGSFGHPTIKTPQLDQIATEGLKWTNFYVASPSCSASRAALMSGRLPARNGTAPTDPARWTFNTNSLGGLPPEEYTIAELLKDNGYATAAIGKWHLGHLPKFLPTNQGFDYYFGIPFSNDMAPTLYRSREVLPEHVDMFEHPQAKHWNVPLMRNEEIIQQPADQETITRQYTEEAVRFIKNNRSKPFFLYLAHNMPHVPVFASPAFRGKSLRGIYGDAVEELDWSVGQVIDALKKSGIAENTLVIFTSDNGPWMVMNQYGGSAGMLRGAKGTTWEGGMREPTIFWWPGKVKSEVVTEMGSTLDLLPTFAALIGASLPKDRVLDGYDLSAVLLKNAKGPRQVMFYYRFQEVVGIRHGRYKLHFKTSDPLSPSDAPVVHEPPLLFDLLVDPSEQYDVADQHPEIVNELIKIRDEHVASFTPPPSQLDLVTNN
ncbi:MAG: sulfatase [Xanthomonadales bacterium]|nr:sulfatase [Xanthomonadales bacterium]